MKSVTFTVLISGLLLVVNSCCTKKYCVGADDIYEIKFYNFSQADLDTIIILSYTKNSNFTTSIDSFTTQASNTGDYFSANTNDNLNTNLDYKIKLYSTGEVFTLTNFEIEKDGCNGCFPYRPKSDFYNKLNAYQINGQRQSGNQIKVFN
jgi:hypothetical protein